MAQRLVLIFALLFLIPNSTKARECVAFPKKRTVSIVQTKARLYGRELEIARIPSDQLFQNTLAVSRLPFPKSVYIGIREDGHMYVVSPTMRYDGEAVYYPPDVRESSLLSDGIVIRLEDESGRLAADLDRFLRSRLVPGGLSCGHGACRLMRYATGAEMIGGSLPVIFTPTFLKRAIQSGFKDRNGQPIKMQMLILGDASPQRLLMMIRGVTAIRMTTAGFFLSYLGVVSAGLSAILFF